MRDLFGEAPAQQSRPGKGLGPQGGKHYVKPWGYVCPPGTGPAGHTCGDCRHLYRNRLAKTYLKCYLARRKWTGGRATDVLAGSPACSKWESDQTSEVQR